MEVLYLKNAYKTLEKYDVKVSKRIVEAIDLIPRGDIKKLRAYENPNIYRLRVGKYRILYYMQSEKIIVVKIDTRGDVYK
jgi:mRNA interferase RelE/StbE